MSDPIVNRLGLVLAATLAACTCPPTTHVEQTYASNIMSDQIQVCAYEGKCTLLCSRAFALEPGIIDGCRIVSLDHNGGAFVEVTWSEYVCTFDDWDSGDDWTYEDDDYDPCWDGSCVPDSDDYPDDLPGDDEPPPDDDEPPPDDDWMDEGPP